MSATDPYDSVKIEQMTGNKVSKPVFTRTIVCLNPRRETRLVTLMTNVTVSSATNVSVVTLTNQTITVGNNQSRTFATNVVAAPPPSSIVATNETGATETNVVVVASTPPNSTNETVTTASNITTSKAGNQNSTLANFQTQLSRQVTLFTNNLSITTADNQSLFAETNLVLTAQTNLTVVSVTNTTVIETNLLLRDYYLFTEFTPPPDFTLQSGESLVLLVDGTRHGLTSATSQTVFVPRKGYTSTLYRVPPELLVDIANAKDVRLRIKGVNSVIERKMSSGSRKAIKKFLVKHFTPEAALSSTDSHAQAANTTHPKS